MKKAKLVTPVDIAKILGVESEYRGILIEQELKITHDGFMNDGFEPVVNNCIDNINENENFK